MHIQVKKAENGRKNIFRDNQTRAKIPRILKRHKIGAAAAITS